MKHLFLFRLIFGICLCIATLGHHEAFARTHQPLVDVAWLKAHLGKSDIVILDIRSPNSRRNPFLEGHIPGARSAPYNKGWRERRDGVIGMLPLEKNIISHIRSLGVNSSSHVIIVPHGRSSTDFSAATRVYWTFTVLGHQQVSILDGGYAAWKHGGGELSSEAKEYVTGDFVGQIDHRLIATQDEVRSLLNEDVVLVDARPRNQYEGKRKSPVVRKFGTIPGANNLAHSTLYDPKTARFASSSDIESFLSNSKIDTETNRSITFCNTGHWASIAWFALHELKGKKDVALYDGSMSEWTQDDDNPVLKLAE